MMGAFSDGNIAQQESGPYYIVTTDSAVPYPKVEGSFKNMMKMLKDRDLHAGSPVAIFQGDMAMVPANQLTARPGVVLNDSLVFDAPYSVIRMPMRRVARANVEASNAIVPFMAFPALSEWMRAEKLRSRPDEPILMIFHLNGSVDVEIALEKAVAGQPQTDSN
jgi:hypothetical protein